MIRHMVFFNVLPTASEEQLKAVIDHARTKLARIPGVQNLAVSTTFEAVQPVSYQYGLTMEFADRAALKAYIDHPVHQEFRQIFFPIRGTYLVTDLEEIEE